MNDAHRMYSSSLIWPQPIGQARSQSRRSGRCGAGLVALMRYLPAVAGERVSASVRSVAVGSKDDLRTLLAEATTYEITP